MTLDLITVGRISVDLYAQEAHQSFSDPQTFRKSIGGSPTNVAVAAARLGLAAAVVTKLGGDQLAPYALAKLASFGVDVTFVGREPTGQTPVVLASLDPQKIHLSSSTEALLRRHHDLDFGCPARRY